MEIREHSLIMLRTNYGEPGVMMYNQELNIFIDDFHSTRKTSNHTPYDLYIISRESIKHGDWFYKVFDNTITKLNGNSKPCCTSYKIIATTDKSIKDLPRISDDFVRTYIKKYNDNEVIYVGLLYKQIGDQSYEIEEDKTDDYPIYDLDINENNTVNIYMMERKTH